MGLNLRNIAWHGFLSPQDVNPAYVAILIVVLVDCGKFLREKRGIVSVPSRPFVTFKEVRPL